MGRVRKKSSNRKFLSFVYVFSGIAAIFLTVFAINSQQSLLQFAAVGDIGAVIDVTKQSDEFRPVWPAVARDAIGIAHVVIDHKVVDVDEEGYEKLLDRYPLYSKGRGRTFLPKPIPLDTTCDGSVGCQPAIAVAPNGRIMAVWSLEEGEGVGYQTWQSTSLPAGPAKRLGDTFGSGFQLGIAADSDNNFHIVGNGDFKVKYCVWNGTACKYYTEIEGKGSASPEVTVDSLGNAFILWRGSPGAPVYIAEHKAGSVTTTVREIGKGINPQIAADGLGNVHLVWSEGWDIHYCRIKLGTPCEETHIFPDGEGIQPSIGVTDQGNILIVYTRKKAKLYYYILNSGQWSGRNELPKGGIHNDVSPYSEKSKLSVVWGSEDKIVYTEIDVGFNEPTPPPPPCKKFDDNGQCAEKESSIGPLSTLPPGFIGRLFEVMLGLTGGFLVLLIMYSGYTYMTSQGNPDQVKKAQEIFRAAILGLVFIVFAFVLLEIIVVDILKLPGFTN